MQLIRIRRVQQKTELSRSSIRRLERLGQFPPRRRLSAGVVAWVEEEIDEWIAGRPPVRSDEDTKEGVR